MAPPRLSSEWWCHHKASSLLNSPVTEHTVSFLRYSRRQPCFFNPYQTRLVNWKTKKSKISFQPFWYDWLFGFVALRSVPDWSRVCNLSVHRFSASVPETKDTSIATTTPVAALPFTNNHQFKWFAPAVYAFVPKRSEWSRTSVSSRSFLSPVSTSFHSRCPKFPEPYRSVSSSWTSLAKPRPRITFSLEWRLPFSFASLR